MKNNFLILALKANFYSKIILEIKDVIFLQKKLAKNLKNYKIENHSKVTNSNQLAIK